MSNEDEEHRYKSVQSQVKHLLDLMNKQPNSLVANLGRALLAGKMHAMNEEAHEQYKAREVLINVLHAQINKISL